MAKVFVVHQSSHAGLEMGGFWRAVSSPWVRLLCVLVQNGCPELAVPQVLHPDPGNYPLHHSLLQKQARQAIIHGDRDKFLCQYFETSGLKQQAMSHMSHTQRAQTGSSTLPWTGSSVLVPAVPPPSLPLLKRVFSQQARGTLLKLVFRCKAHFARQRLSCSWSPLHKNICPSNWRTVKYKYLWRLQGKPGSSIWLCSSWQNSVAKWPI